MADFKYNVTIHAANPTQAREQMQALIDIKKSMSAEDLIFFAGKVKANPGLIQTAKKWL